jgi:hypothetical protein
MTKAQTTAISYADMAMQVATHALSHDTAKEAAAKALADANVLIAKFSKDKVKIGNNNKCPNATAFHSTLVKGGKAKGTANNYLMEFRKAVETGKPLTGWNSSQTKNKGKTDAKGKSKTKLEALVLRLYKHPEFNILATRIDSSEGWVTEIIEDYLLASGVLKPKAK